MATPSAAARRLGFITESIRVIVPLLILAAGFGFLFISGSLKKTPQKPPAVVGPPRVRTALVTHYEGQMSIDVDGLVVPYREIVLTSEVAGSILTKNPLCRAGRYVKASTVLIEIDPIDYELELKRLQQQLRQAEISVHEIDVQLENLKELALLAEQEQGLQLAEVDRLRSLVNGKIVAQSDLDDARSGEIISRNAVQQLVNQARVLVARRASTEASIALAKTQVEQAELNLSRTKITAPVDGVIVRDLVEEGAYVQRGMALVEFDDTSAVEVRCNLMSSDLARLTRGHANSSAYGLPNVPAQVIVTRGSRRFVWDGVLSRFDGMGLDEKTRMFPCRILVDDPTGGRWLTTASVVAEDHPRAPTLMRGMYTQVEISVPSEKRLVTIPRKALQLGDVVWRVRDGTLAIRKVNIARRLPDTVVIELDDGDDLRIDDRVVVTPLTTAVDGMAIEEIAVDDVGDAEIPVESPPNEELDEFTEGESPQRSTSEEVNPDLANEPLQDASASPRRRLANDIPSGAIV